MRVLKVLVKFLIAVAGALVFLLFVLYQLLKPEEGEDDEVS